MASDLVAWPNALAGFAFTDYGPEYPKAERLAADLVAITGESKTQAVIKALQERLEVVARRQRKRLLRERLDDIAKHCASLPVLDSRSPEERLYDERGMTPEDYREISGSHTER